MEFLGSSTNIGGISGQSRGIIESCGNYGLIEGACSVGGISGYVGGGRVLKCFGKGNGVSATKRANGDSMAGGIVGCLVSTGSDSGILRSCYNLASVSGTRNVLSVDWLVLVEIVGHLVIPIVILVILILLEK